MRITAERRLIAPLLLITAFFLGMTSGTHGAGIQITIGDVTITANSPMNTSNNANEIVFNSANAGNAGFKVPNGWAVQGTVMLDGPGGSLINAMESITLTQFTLTQTANTAGTLDITFQNTFNNLAPKVFAADNLSGMMVVPVGGDTVSWQSKVGGTAVAPPAGPYVFTSQALGNSMVISGGHNTGKDMIASGNGTLMGILAFDLKSNIVANKITQVNFPNSAEVGVGDVSIQSVPEPGSLAMLATGLLCSLVLARMWRGRPEATGSSGPIDG
jgi:PEP-CTERM motif